MQVPIDEVPWKQSVTVLHMVYTDTVLQSKLKENQLKKDHNIDYEDGWHPVSGIRYLLGNLA